MRSIYGLFACITCFFMLSACSVTKGSTNVETNKLKKSIAIKSKKVYLENEPIRFEINAGESQGYLSLVYIDKQGKTNIIYANKNIAMEKSRDVAFKENNESLFFPEDFGNLVLLAKKDCKKCKTEKTEILIIFSDDPIDDLENKSKRELFSLNLKSVKVKNRGLSLFSKVIVRKFEFFVK